MNTIERLTFDFRMDNEAFARALYGRWERFFAQNVERIADAVLAKHNRPSETLEIGGLQLDLGTLDQEAFDEQFPLRFRAQLEEALLQCLYRQPPANAPAQVRSIPAQVHAFEQLAYFLLHGVLPWTASGAERDIRRLFAGVLRENGGLLLQFLRTYGHYTSLQERLVYQLDDAELEGGVSLLSPEWGAFICSYVRLLRAKYRETAQPEGIRESDHRHTVWLVVYAYLLSSGGGSYFDRKNFVAQTIAGLAAKYNSSYEQLLKLITGELKAFAKAIAAPPELFAILLSLRRELSEKEWKTSSTNAAKFYKTIYALLKSNTAQDISPSSRNALVAVLSGVSSCRLFLQQLQEEEIIALTPVVAPAESGFVVATAKSLDEQKEQGALQGKAGGEFRLLKWQIIFPLLFENGGAGFNRKYFVEGVLRRVSAHYSIEMALLLGYFLANPQSLERLDGELLRIFRELALPSHKAPSASLTTTALASPDDFPSLSAIKAQSSKNTKSSKSSKSSKNSKDFIHSIHSNSANSVDSANSANSANSDNIDNSVSINSANSALSSLATLNSLASIPESVRYTFLSARFPEESPFIAAYVRGLDALPEVNRLQGKAGGEFRDVKWRFVFAALGEMPEHSFSRKYFVSSVLRGLSAHYNLDYLDLLRYFRPDNPQKQGLPFPLQQILADLLREENARCGAMKQLEGLSPQDRLLVDACAKSMDACRDRGNLLGKASGSFEEIKWRFIVEVLLEFQNAAFGKKPLVRRALRRIAAHYNLSLAELLDYFYAATDFPAAQKLRKIMEEIRQTEERRGRHAAADGRKIAEDRPTEDRKAEDRPAESRPAEGRKAEQPVSTFIGNAGMALLSPYLPRLFAVLGLTEDGRFAGRDAQIRAMFAMQHAVFGQAEAEYPEYEMTLNKLLTGFETGIPIPRRMALTEQEQEAVSSMLQGLLQHWEKLKNTSPAGLREGFLARNGKLEEREDFYLLTVEEKSYDMLLDSCPWSFRAIKYSWMKKAINVKWR
jgi:hypothetical protein